MIIITIIVIIISILIITMIKVIIIIIMTGPILVVTQHARGERGSALLSLLDAR